MSEIVRSVGPTPENSGQHPIRTAHPRGRGRVLRTVALLVGSWALAACVAPSPVEAPFEPYNEGFITPKPVVVTPEKVDTFLSKPIIDSGRFPQCTGLAYPDPKDLYRHPLSYDNPLNPQVRHALDTMRANGVGGIIKMDLLPQGTKLEFDQTLSIFYCLPDHIGPLRELVQIGTNVARSLPSPSKKWPIEITLPEGLNPILVQREGHPRGGGPKSIEEWLFLNLHPHQTFTLKGAPGLFEMQARGPVAFPLTWENPGGDENPVLMATPIIPSSGFGFDRPLLALEDLYPGAIIHGESKVGVENHSGLSVLASCADSHPNEPLGHVYGTSGPHLDLMANMDKAAMERAGKWHADLGSVWRKIRDLQTGQEAYLGVSSHPTNDRAEFHGSVHNIRGTDFATGLLRLIQGRPYEVIAFAAHYGDGVSVPETQIPLSRVAFSLDCAFID